MWKNDAEKVQKGNPHELTVNQHCFPTANIERFADQDGLVEVLIIKSKKRVRLKPTNQLFCAQRVWDQRAESGYMKRIEDDFQSLANDITNGGKWKLETEDHQRITAMFALWNIRAHRRNSPIKDIRVQGVVGVTQEIEKDGQEFLEKNGIASVRPDLHFPGRLLSGINIQMNLNEVQEQMKDARWGIFQASELEFIVPDIVQSVHILPLTPKLCLCSPCENQKANAGVVSRINQILRGDSVHYYFASNLENCFITPE